MRLLPVLLAMLMAVPSLAHAQEEVAPQENAKVTTVREGLYMLVSPQGGNIAVSTGADGTFIIDDQLTPRAEIIEANIKSLTNRPIKFVLNTHFHFDHTGGNEHFGEGGAIIVAHENVRKRLNAKQFITYFGREMEPLSKSGLPVVTFSRDVSLHYNGDMINVHHAPNGHTDGDAFAHFMDDNVIVAGDLVFNGIYPFIDVEHGGSIKGVVAGLGKMIDLANEETLIVPGHGPLMTYGELVEYRAMLATISGRIESDIKAGKTLEEIVAAKPTADFDSGMGEGIVRPDAFVELVYNDLSGKTQAVPHDHFQRQQEEPGESEEE